MLLTLHLITIQLFKNLGNHQAFLSSGTPIIIIIIMLSTDPIRAQCLLQNLENYNITPWKAMTLTVTNHANDIIKLKLTSFSYNKAQVITGFPRSFTDKKSKTL